MSEQFDIHQARAEGMTIAEAARELGVSYNAARQRASRAGIALTRERYAGYEATARDMRPIEAVDYLLGVIESLLNIQPAGPMFPFPLTVLQERLFGALVGRPRAVVSQGSLFNAMYFDRAEDDRPQSMKIVDVQICKTRKVLPPTFGHIENVWGRGYRFVPAADTLRGN